MMDKQVCRVSGGLTDKMRRQARVCLIDIIHLTKRNIPHMLGHN